MKKNILLLINGFGVEQRDSYNIYKKELMPNLDRLTVEGLFSTLSSNYLDYKDGYRNLTLYNAIKNMNNDKKRSLVKNSNKNLVNSLRGVSHDKVIEKKRSISSKIKARFCNILRNDDTN